jgi:hypothetical protein
LAAVAEQAPVQESAQLKVVVEKEEQLQEKVMAVETAQQVVQQAHR